LREAHGKEKFVKRSGLLDQSMWPRLAIGALLLTLIFDRLTGTVADMDLWGYMAFGRLYWETGKFPYQDVFSYVPTLDPWVYHEWLTGVVFYLIYQTLGGAGLQILKYGSGLGALSLVYLTARQRGAEPLAAALGVYLVHGLLRLGYSPVRAQVFTIFFFALSLYLLERARQRGFWRGLWLLAPIQILWCNLHGGFVAGLALTGIYALGETISRRTSRPFWGALLISGLVTLVNPYGLDYWTYMVRALSLTRPEILEWASVYHLYGLGMPRGPLVYFLFLSIFAVIWGIRKREVTPGLALGLAMFLGWKHQRHQVLFLLLAGTYLPDLMTVYLEDLRARPGFLAAWRRLGWKVPAVVGLLITLYSFQHAWRQNPLSIKTPALPGMETESLTYYPQGAVDYLRQHRLSGKILVYFDWGEYLIWMLYPQCRVALDGRFETVYPESVTREYFDFIFARDNWRQFLNKYPPDLILLDSRSQICTLIRGAPDWLPVYTDPGCTLFKRRK
jgi:hypothetical protein